MRVLVTGGSGFIGSNLALTLKAMKVDVAVIDRSPNEQISSQFEWHVGDVSQRCEVDGPIDAIFHQAAITDPRHGNDNETFESNCRGFENVIALAEKKNAKLIYASTAGLYGNGPTPMKEDQKKECLTAYGRSKLWMDQLAETLFTKRHIVGLRYFNVFGPREAHKGRPASMIYHLYMQMKDGKRPRIFHYGEQRRDHIYIKDVVRANLCALDAPSGVYNVGTGIGTSFNEVVMTLNKVMKTDLPPEYFPMPYDPTTYQSNTQADTQLAETKLKFRAEWKLDAAIADYIESIR